MTDAVKTLWREIMHLGFMPCCGLPVHYQEGPHGGLCVNIRCAHCGAEWNIGPMLVERIGVPKDWFIQVLVDSLNKAQARRDV